MLNKTILLFFIFSVLFFTDVIYAAVDKNKTLYISTPEWKNWTNKEGTGFYFELAKLIYQPLGYKISYKIVPFARAKLLVKYKKTDAIFSLYERDEQDDILTPKYPIDAGSIMVMFNKRIIWEGIKSLQHKNVIIPRSYRYANEIKTDFKAMEVNDSKHGMLMLLKGRAPFFITDSDEMAQLQQELDVDVAQFHTEMVYSKNLYMAFAKTDKGKLLAKEFDQRMKSLISQGVIKQLYKKWGFKQYVNFVAY
ncbi:MAG: transporter substrate-binding domain-containing protein [Alteromonadaceae bacterium]|nr:transporter substrate-binding domain-containing protein [Alteromonadaceae bacterium]